MMFFSFFLFLSLVSQETYLDNLHFYPFVLKPQQIQTSPFRGEENIFEVTQPYILFLKTDLLFYDITNNKKIPFPGKFAYHSEIGNLPFQENFEIPAYISESIYFNTVQSVYSPVNSDAYPVYLIPKRFRAQTPFSQIRLFKRKTGAENIEFSFGRNITEYGRVNIAADYLDETSGTKRSVVLDTDFELPFNNHSHLIFLNTKDDNYSNPFENSLTYFSISRKQGDIGLFRKNMGAEDIFALVSNIRLSIPHQEITFGLDYPNFDSTNYLITLIDRINAPPLFYFVPRFVIDADKEYALSLGLGYHPTVDIFLFGNILSRKQGKFFYNLGLRKRTNNALFETYVYSPKKAVPDSSGIVLFYDGNVLPDLSISSVIATKLNAEYFLYIEPLYQKTFKEGKLKSGIFCGIQYPGDDIHKETNINVGILTQIVDVSLYFILDQVNSNEDREYRFGVQWNFYD